MADFPHPVLSFAVLPPRTMNAAQIDQVRQVVSTVFSELGATGPIGEIFLLRNQCYAGRKFLVDDFEALWQFDTGLIQFFDVEGRLVQTRRVEADAEQTQSAA